jgi:FKBP-type peptidyl-prolyl cis-trans isomerase FklB
MLKILVAWFVSSGIGVPALAGEPPKGEHDRISYSIGYQVASDLKDNAIAINPAQILRAVADVSADAPPALSTEDMHAVLIEFRRRMLATQKQRQQDMLARQRDNGRTFLAANGKKPGVVTTASGLQYRVLRPGRGRSPTPEDEVTVRYRGTTLDGKEFDSSARRGEPARFKLDTVMPGWREGLQQIKAGGKVALFVPSALGYGERGPLADQTLIFEVELLAVNDRASTRDGRAEK